MILIKGTPFWMGSNTKDGFIYDREGPATLVNINDFYIDQTSVTNQAFQKFIFATNYKTTAEQFGNSSVFVALLTEAQRQKLQPADQLGIWWVVPGADWQHPEGPDSNILERMDHPVVHVSYLDAQAYCRWANKRLPTEAEWEFAARGGLEAQRFPWGNEIRPNGKIQFNNWQGDFPFGNTKEDGFLSTAPAKYYEPNAYNVYQMIGNVWEWCHNEKNKNLDFFAKYSTPEILQIPFSLHKHYALRGGSYLCHDNFCKRYKTYSRNGTTPETTSGNVGFRCAKDI